MFSIENMINAVRYWVGRSTYSMYGSRSYSDGTNDCSGAVYYGVRKGGGYAYGYIPSTETLHDYLTRVGFKLIAENRDFPMQRGDVIIWGRKGQSAGAGGHTGIALDNQNWVECTAWKNGTIVSNHDQRWAMAGGPYFYAYRYAGTQTPSKPKQPTINQGQSKPGKGLWYRVHIAHQGWLGWVKDGNIAGTTGKGIPIEAIEIQYNGIGDLITSKGHSQSIGWRPWGYNVVGTTGQAKSLEAFQLWLGEYLTKQGYSIEYRTHVAKLGWQSWVKDGAISGTTGKKLAIEAIEFRMRKNGKTGSR